MDIRHCASCEVPEESKDGVILFVGDYCEECNDRMELGRIACEDSIRSMDFDYTLN
jgi:hypothetical protein